MSDNTPTDAKPARKPRKSAPRRRKPAAKSTPQTKAETTASEGVATPITTEAPLPAQAMTKPEPSQAVAGTGTGTGPAPAAAPESRAPASAPKPSAKRERKEAARSSAHRPAPASTREEKPAPPSVQAPLPPSAPRVLIRVPLDVRWRDLDAFNHVNNSKYLSYLEEARLQWMLTMPGQGLDDHVAPVVAAAHLNYRRPIEWPNAVMVELFVERLGNTSVSIGHRIVARDDTSVLYCDGNVVMVWIDRGTGAAAPLPAEVRAACG